MVWRCEVVCERTKTSTDFVLSVMHAPFLGCVRKACREESGPIAWMRRFNYSCIVSTSVRVAFHSHRELYFSSY